MKAFIQALNEAPWNEECAAAYRGFQALGIECILFSSTEALITKHPEDIVVGGTLIMHHAFAEHEISPLNFSYPQELNDYYGRKIWRTKLCDLSKENFPLFIKPVQDKAAPGLVLNHFSDVAESEYATLDPQTDILCSEVVEFNTEWRCFIRYNEILDVRYYRGDKNIKCDYSVIRKAVENYSNSPAGYALDFGVTQDGRTLLIEMNDAFALGCYGLNDILYAKLLLSRWAELTNTKDFFKN